MSGSSTIAQSAGGPYVRYGQNANYRELVAQDDALRRTVFWERTHPLREVDLNGFDYASEDEVLAELAEYDG